MTTYSVWFPFLKRFFVCCCSPLQSVAVCCTLLHRVMCQKQWLCIFSGYPYEWVLSHTCMSHVTHINKSCHTYEWVVSHIWTSRVTHMNESCHTYERVVSHIWTSHVTHMNESCHTFYCVVSRIWMRRITHTHMIESRYIYHRVMSCISESLFGHFRFLFFRVLFHVFT